MITDRICYKDERDFAYEVNLPGENYVKNYDKGA